MRGREAWWSRCGAAAPSPVLAETATLGWPRGRGCCRVAPLRSRPGAGAAEPSLPPGCPEGQVQPPGRGRGRPGTGLGRGSVCPGRGRTRIPRDFPLLFKPELPGSRTRPLVAAAPGVACCLRALARPRPPAPPRRGHLQPEEPAGHAVVPPRPLLAAPSPRPSCPHRMSWMLPVLFPCGLFFFFFPQIKFYLKDQRQRSSISRCTSHMPTTASQEPEFRPGLPGGWQEPVLSLPGCALRSWVCRWGRQGTVGRE